MKDNKDKVYSEFLGDPSINKKELAKENEKFLEGNLSDAEQAKILHTKITRIEKIAYATFVECSIGLAFIMFMLFFRQ